MQYNIKYDPKIYGSFYSPLRILSYNGKLYYISLGQRSIGKSTGFTIHCLLEYLIHGKEFIYLRRDKDELDNNKLQSFENAIKIINQFYGYDVIFSYKNERDIYYINGDKETGKEWEKIGFSIPLSLQQKYKSNNFSNVYYILYDEFISFNHRYIGGQKNMFQEVYALESLIQTVDRNVGEAYSNRVKCICIGNSITYYNPLMLSLDIDKYLNSEVKFLSPKNSYYVLEQTNEVEATKNMKSSILYKASSEYNKKYAFNNQSTDDNQEFIEIPHGTLNPLFNVRFDGQEFCVYFTDDYDIYIDSKSCNVRGVQTFALSNSDHKINTILIDKWRQSEAMKLVRNQYIQGRVKFKNGRCKFMLNQYFKYD